MSSNTAAWLVEPKSHSLEVKSAPYTSPGKSEIVIRARATAINPVDWHLQDVGIRVFPWMKYPGILGFDVSGDVVEVGAGVTRFNTGDRVVGTATGLDKSRNTSVKCAFQSYVVLEEPFTSEIPNSMSYESACVIPLGLATAAVSLFHKDHLDLDLPTLDSKPNGKTVIIWAASTSVGSNAIQLAIAAGYEVFTTCSPKNFEYAKKLGASQVFDYKSKTLVDDMVRALKGKTVAGAAAIGRGAPEACVAILSHCQGNKCIAMPTFPVPENKPTFALVRTLWYMATWFAGHWFRATMGGVKWKMVFASMDNFGMGEHLYRQFLPEAMARGTFVPQPPPEVVAHGLGEIQHAMNVQKKGVSAKKIVVTFGYRRVIGCRELHFGW